MYTAVIVLLILVGLFLLMLEMFVIPGITVAGVAGLAFTVVGVWLAYDAFGTTYGTISLLGSLLAFGAMLWMALRSGTWDRLMLKSSVPHAVEPIQDSLIHEGDTGLTLSRLNPVGKARIQNQVVEAHCPGHLVDPQTEVVVQKVFKTHVIVKLKS